MDIRHLQYFLKVAQYKSFTKAAHTLYISQPTISKMIKSLEEDLGVVLFNRFGKQIELTDAGQIIFNQAQGIVHSFQNLSSELDDLMNLKKGHLQIGLPPMVGSSFFPKVIGEFRGQYSDITIKLVENGSKKIEDDIEKGLLDIGVVLSPTNEEMFNTFPLAKEKLMLLVHPSHSLAGKKNVSLSELAQESFIIFREDFALYGRVIAECMQVGFQPHVVYESSQWDFISEMVAANLGISLLPEPICRELDADRIQVLPLIDPIIPWHLTMIWRKDRYLSFAAREWIRFTKNYFSEKLV